MCCRRQRSFRDRGVAAADGSGSSDVRVGRRLARCVAGLGRAPRPSHSKQENNLQTPSNQLGASRAIQQEFEAFKNVEVIDGSVSARALLPRVGHLVLIQSTVTLEALQTGRRVCILPFLHYQVHKELFDRRAVTVTPTLEDLLRALDLSPDSSAPPSFFDRFDAAAAAQLLRALYDGGVRPARAHE